MSASFSRILAVMLVLLILAAVWRLAIQPAWSAWREDSEVIETTREAIARFKGVAQSRDALLRSLEVVRSNPALKGALMNASTPTLAAAQLQQQLKATVEAAGGSMVSSQVLDGQPDGTFVKVRVNVRMTLSVPQLQQVLYELESQRPVLMVDELLILSRTRSSRSSRRKAVAAKTNLDVRAQLSGYMPAAAGTTQPAASATRPARLAARSGQER